MNDILELLPISVTDQQVLQFKVFSKDNRVYLEIDGFVNKEQANVFAKLQNDYLARIEIENATIH